MGTIVMILLVMILPYQFATNNIICITKKIIAIECKIGNNKYRYLLVVPSIVSLPILNWIVNY